MKKRVCVLLSTYNGEKYLDEQLDSLIRQENVDIDILVRDDGSTDSTFDLVSNFTYDSRVNLIYKDNYTSSYATKRRH